MAKLRKDGKPKQSGQPRKYGTPAEMAKKVAEYFSIEDVKTITGLALHLDFESRQSFYDYEKIPEYSYIIKNARLRVESNYERMMYSKTPTGAIFALKNMGWSDKQEHEHTGKDGGAIEVTVNVVNKKK